MTTTRRDVRVPPPSGDADNLSQEQRREWWLWHYAGQALAGYSSGLFAREAASDDRHEWPGDDTVADWSFEQAESLVKRLEWTADDDEKEPADV